MRYFFRYTLIVIFWIFIFSRSVFSENNSEKWTIIAIQPFYEQNSNAHQIVQIKKIFTTKNQCEKFLHLNFLNKKRKAYNMKKTGSYHIMQHYKSNGRKHIHWEWSCLKITI